MTPLVKVKARRRVFKVGKSETGKNKQIFINTNLVFCNKSDVSPPVSCALSRSLQRYVAEEVGHRLAVVGSPDRLRQDHGDVYDLEETETYKPTRSVGWNASRTDASLR